MDAPAAAPIGFGHSGTTTRKPGSGCSVARSVMRCGPGTALGCDPPAQRGPPSGTACATIRRRPTTRRRRPSRSSPRGEPKTAVLDPRKAGVRRGAHSKSPTIADPGPSTVCTLEQLRSARTRMLEGAARSSSTNRWEMSAATRGPAAASVSHGERQQRRSRAHAPGSRPHGRTAARCENDEQQRSTTEEHRVAAESAAE